jgi:hypothetical protein
VDGDVWVVTNGAAFVRANGSTFIVAGTPTVTTVSSFSNSWTGTLRFWVDPIGMLHTDGQLVAPGGGCGTSPYTFSSHPTKVVDAQAWDVTGAAFTGMGVSTGGVLTFTCGAGDTVRFNNVSYAPF